ncbi:hypothetical protein [Leptolyngbya ohadii]|uniref:hypothetical protein n=1 Tax=Leptolyngbya ohadii TaxID=1962290 RepID=UPI000B59A8A0|nr:hypothetical protein [Leptolyngbya ohadii]
MGYPLFRKKAIGATQISCGLGNLLKNISRYDAGVDFECSVVINRFQNSPQGRSQNPKANSLFTAIDRIPVLKPFLLNYPQTNSPEKYEQFIGQYPFVQQCFYRDNINQDIGAYDYFYAYLRQQKYSGQVVFINSSVRGPQEDGWLRKYKTLFEAEPDTGFCGISLNSHYQAPDARFFFLPHVQSFFIYTSMAVLEKVFPNGLLEGKNIVDKNELVEQGEVGISTRVLQAGLGIRSSSFPEFFYRAGQKWTIPEGDIRFQAAYAHRANAC